MIERGAHGGRSIRRAVTRTHGNRAAVHTHEAQVDDGQPRPLEELMQRREREQRHVLERQRLKVVAHRLLREIRHLNHRNPVCRKHCAHALHEVERIECVLERVPADDEPRRLEPFAISQSCR